MLGKHMERRVRETFADAGIAIGGDRPHDVRVHDPAFYRNLCLHGDTGLATSYIAGHFDCDRLDEMVFRLLKADAHKRSPSLMNIPFSLLRHVLNLQSRARSASSGKRHYETGNDLFRAMLDERMIYSCAYWRNAGTLADAQVAKLDLIACKLQLREGMRVLDIGCGWGGAARHFAERHKVSVTGITVSGAQHALAQETCAGADVTILLEDYRDHRGSYDAVYSIGMFEHVGAKNHRDYMRMVRRCLKPEHGAFLLHTIGTDYAATFRDRSTWINREIFPDGELPSQRQLARAIEGLFIVDDWQNFGADYDRTLLCWHDNFEAAYPGLKDRYGETFRRKWRYFLLGCAGAFRARHVQLWQVLLSSVDSLRRPLEIPACR